LRVPEQPVAEIEPDLSNIKAREPEHLATRVRYGVSSRLWWHDVGVAGDDLRALKGGRVKRLTRMIYCSPFPLNGIRDCTKYQAEHLLATAEKHEPGFCERHGIPFEDAKQFPLGPVKHQKLIEKVWPAIPHAAKIEFLKSQFSDGFNYLLRCADAFRSADLKMPDEVEGTIRRLLGCP
jgi:hypothetical protein